MKSACVGVLSIIELKNTRWNIEIQKCTKVCYNNVPYVLIIGACIG